MTNQMNITAEQVNEMLKLHADAERRLEKAMERGSNNENIYRAECLAIERVFDIIGIEWC